MNAVPPVSPPPLAAHEFQAVASLLQKGGAGFESSIRGTSMEPTLPDGVRIRIGPPPAGGPAVGQIAACVIGESLFAHRIVIRGHDRRGLFVLTQGDGWLLCDPPSRADRILGIVTQYLEGESWRVPGPPVERASWRRIVARASVGVVRICIPVHDQFARHVAGIFLALGAVLKGLFGAAPPHGIARVPRP